MSGVPLRYRGRSLSAVTPGPCVLHAASSLRTTAPTYQNRHRRPLSHPSIQSHACTVCLPFYGLGDRKSSSVEWKPVTERRFLHWASRGLQIRAEKVQRRTCLRCLAMSCSLAIQVTTHSGMKRFFLMKLGLHPVKPSLLQYNTDEWIYYLRFLHSFLIFSELITCSMNFLSCLVNLLTVES
jgi:hypothetical protein